MSRVLRIGGKFLCLEFSAVDVPGLDRLYDFYSFNVIPALGRVVVGDAQSYRYLVESINTVLFWIVPIVYSFSIIPPVYAEIYKLNPLAALIMAMRNILMDGYAPRWELLVKLTFVAVFTFAFGFVVFRRLKRRFYDHL